MDAKSNANTIDALDLLVDLSSCAKQILSFTYGNFLDESDNEDGLYISVGNGGTFTKVYSFDMANTIDTCITVSFDIDSLASTKGLELTETSILRWSHAGNNTIESGNDGFYIDNIKLDLANLDPVDAGIVEITTPDTTFQGPESEVIVRMSNLGPDTLASSQINFQLGTGKVFSEFWGGCLNVGDTTEITLNNVLTTTTLGQQKLCVWTSNPNGLEDLNTTNDTSCINLNITALGIGKLVINKPGIKIYPNPVKDQLYIEYQINSNSEIKIELYNILGKKSYEKTIMGSNEGFYKKLINLPNLNNGTHILVFQSDHEIISRKLFVIK
ncbi:MAG: T9SS type A sorting domain-containing protein [Bacteroidia bacterium]|nr:T9SS type A sorting domain-containing protein [Bacteroidia bacterium]